MDAGCWMLDRNVSQRNKPQITQMDTDSIADPPQRRKVRQASQDKTQRRRDAEIGLIAAVNDFGLMVARRPAGCPRPRAEDPIPVRSDSETWRLGIRSHESWHVPTARPSSLLSFKDVVRYFPVPISRRISRFLIVKTESEPQAEPTRRRRGELLIQMPTTNVAFVVGI